MNMPRISTGAIIEKDSRFLLGKRSKEPYLGEWTFPGGKIEYNEKAEDAIIREVKEEIGVDFEPSEFIGYLDEIPTEKGHCVSLWFKGAIKGEPKPDNKEISEIKWFTLEELKKVKLAYRQDLLFEKRFLQ
ncbi:NUDIX hydrolase [Candidatus Woesearchaeota archaeon]|nr:NUDIX hydrolase [Candidatus Woesearchaeota archaeon]